MNAITAELQTSNQQHANEFTGMKLITGGPIVCNEIGPGDFAVVDFDKREVTTDGLYVVQIGDGIACRRFEFSVLGGMNVDGEPYQGGAQVLGRVERIYTPKAFQ